METVLFANPTWMLLRFPEKNANPPRSVLQKLTGFQPAHSRKEDAQDSTSAIAALIDFSLQLLEWTKPRPKAKISGHGIHGEDDGMWERNFDLSRTDNCEDETW